MDEAKIKPWEVGMLGTLGYLNGVLNVMLGLGIIYSRTTLGLVEDVTDPAAIFGIGLIAIGLGVAYIRLTNWLMDGHRGGQGLLAALTVAGLLFAVWSIFAMTGMQLLGFTVSAVSAVLMFGLLFNRRSSHYFATHHHHVQHGL